MSIITAHSQAIVGEPEVVEDASIAEQSAAWKLLGQACQRLGMLEEARQAWHNGLEVARKRGDKQTEKEMTVFLRRLEKAARAPEA